MTNPNPDMNAEIARLNDAVDSTPIQSDMVMQHEMYSNWIKAGFTSRQALWLLGNIINPNGSRPPGADDKDPED